MVNNLNEKKFYLVLGSLVRATTPSRGMPGTLVNGLCCIPKDMATIAFILAGRELEKRGREGGRGREKRESDASVQGMEREGTIGEERTYFFTGSGRSTIQHASRDSGE
jgi:hypothetical protein